MTEWRIVGRVRCLLVLIFFLPALEYLLLISSTAPGSMLRTYKLGNNDLNAKSAIVINNMSKPSEQYGPEIYEHVNINNSTSGFGSWYDYDFKSTTTTSMTHCNESTDSLDCSMACVLHEVTGETLWEGSANVYLIYGRDLFNRAKLFNVGFKEALKAGGWKCFIFHDIDLLPINTRNRYSCSRQPRHMSVAIDYYNFKLPYYNLFGGVSAMTLKQFSRVNGFSNSYWGWGGEDDDMYHRLKRMRYHIARYPISIARYTSLYHEKGHPNPERYNLLLKSLKKSKLPKVDGLTTLTYEVVRKVEHRLYTHLLVDIAAERKKLLSKKQLLLQLIPDKVNNKIL